MIADLLEYIILGLIAFAAIAAGVLSFKAMMINASTDKTLFESVREVKRSKKRFEKNISKSYLGRLFKRIINIRITFKNR